MKPCILFGATPWSSRIFIDNFSSNPPAEQINVSGNQRYFSTVDKSITSGDITVKLIGPSNIDLFHNISRGVRVSINTDTMTTSLRPGTQYISVPIPPPISDNTYRFTLVNNEVSFFINDAYSHKYGLSGIPEIKMVFDNNVSYFDFYFNSTSSEECYVSPDEASTTTSSENGVEKYKSSIIYSSVFAGLLVVGAGVAYASRKKNTTKNTLQVEPTKPVEYTNAEKAFVDSPQRESIDIYGGDEDIDLINARTIGNRNRSANPS